jgi:DNA-binding NtrC family response regulator
MALETEAAQHVMGTGIMPGDERETTMAQELVAGSAQAEPEGLKQRVAAYERRLIQEALWLAGGNQRRAAAALGCLPTTLNEKMRRYGLRGLSYLTNPADPGEPPVDRAPYPAS